MYSLAAVSRVGSRRVSKRVGRRVSRMVRRVKRLGTCTLCCCSTSSG